MTNPPHRVMLDLSYASLGYCGMAQESRVLLKTLSQISRIEPTGLLFGRGNAVLAHRFASNSRHARRTEKQALFLQALADGVPPSPVLPWMHWWQRFRILWRCLVSRKVALDQLDNDFHWDVVWRTLLSRSLSEKDIGIAQRCPMLLANMGGTMLAAKSVLGLPSVKLDTRGFDFAIFHDSQPVTVSPGTCKLIRYYDLIPGVRPDLVHNANSIKNHFRAIRRCLGDSIFVCNSDPTRADLLRVFPELEQRSVCIPNVLPDCYYPEFEPRMLAKIIASRQSSAAAPHPVPAIKELLKRGAFPPYLIMTSTIEPRKNHVGLIRAFERLTARHKTDLRLVIVGSPGWKYKEALQAMVPLIKQHRLFHLENVPIAELRILYTHAKALVFPSFYEGFGYSPLEAMCCHTPALVSDIATHRWVHGDAVLYCDPYRIESITEGMERILKDRALREELVAKGIQRVERYKPSAVGAQWLTLFEEILRNYSFLNNGPSSSSFGSSADEGHAPIARCNFSEAGSKIMV